MLQTNASQPLLQSEDEEPVEGLFQALKLELEGFSHAIQTRQYSIEQMIAAIYISAVVAAHSSENTQAAIMNPFLHSLEHARWIAHSPSFNAQQIGECLDRLKSSTTSWPESLQLYCEHPTNEDLMNKIAGHIKRAIVKEAEILDLMKENKRLEHSNESLKEERVMFVWDGLMFVGVGVLTVVVSCIIIYKIWLAAERIRWMALLLRTFGGRR